MKTRITKNKKTLRKTKRKRGGLFENLFNITKDKKIKDNYYQTVIVVDNKPYTLNYYTASNTIFLKTAEPLLRIPTFNIITKNKIIPYKFKIGGLYVSTIIKWENNWYAITRILDHIKKGDVKALTYYEISDVFLNTNEKLFLTKLKTYKIKKDTVDILNYRIIEKKEWMYKLLETFYIQQEAGGFVKEVAVVEAAEVAADNVDFFI
jgi:hypothetical protein